MDHHQRIGDSSGHMVEDIARGARADRRPRLESRSMNTCRWWEGRSS